MGIGDNSVEALKKVMAEICAHPVEEDGVVFLVETLHIEERTEGRAYQGLHLEMGASLGSSRLRLEIDIAFGEAVVPPPMEVELPSVLDKPRARLRAYQKETAIAEKCQAMVSLGMANTRMKDFYDLWYLSKAFSFDGAQLKAALEGTFTRRQTAYPVNGLPIALTDTFAKDTLKKRQWSAFLGKGSVRKGEVELELVTQQIRKFLQPPLGALRNGSEYSHFWEPELGWHDHKAES